MKIQTQENKNKKSVLNITFGIFAVSIAIFTAIGAIIVNEFSSMQQLEELNVVEQNDTVKGNIDDRLRFIELQDSDKIVSVEQIAQQQKEEPADEIAIFFDNDNQKTKFQEYNEKYKKDKKQEDPPMEAQKEEEKKVNNGNGDVPFIKELPPPSSSPLNMKVVIGNYATKEEAQEGLISIQNKFTEAPFIKVINGRYAIQVASFKTPATAHDFADSLRSQGHYVRIIEE